MVTYRECFEVIKLFGYIYKFTNKIDGKIYIGKHKYPFPELDKKYLASGVLIRRALEKHGLDNFYQEMVCTCDTEKELNEKEIFYIKHFDCMSPNGYNLTEGGDGISNPSEEIRRINREKHIGVKRSRESVQKGVESRKWYKPSDETKMKISLVNKGQKVYDYQKELSSKRHLGSHWYNNGETEVMLLDSMEVPKGMVRGRLKNPFPSSKGKKMSEDTKQKISKNKKGIVWVNNGETEKMCLPTEIPSGFVIGRLKQQ